MKKKALIITYYWPPAGGPGVQRVLNIVEHLPDLGWEPIILTVENPSAPAIDKSLLSRIPEDCKIYRTRTSEPFTAYKKLTGKKIEEALPKNISTDKKLRLSERLSRWVRANFFIPDARKGWKKYMVKEGLKIIENEKPDIIFSTSPPHSLQLGAKQLAKNSGIPWVSDLRDPWTEAYWETQMPKTIFSRNKNLKYEKEVLKTATHITTVGSGIKDLIQHKTKRPVSVVYNGYRDIENQFVKTEDFEIVHLGNLSSMQSCYELIEAISLLSKEEKKKLRLVFIGTLANEYKIKLNSYSDIKAEYINYLPYKDMIARARSASMLFLPKLNSTYSKSLISAKIFDYLALQRPILAITEEGSDIEGILQQTKSGRAFQAENIDGIRTYIQTTLNDPDVFSPIKSELRAYSIKENVLKLATIFNKLSSLK